MYKRRSKFKLKFEKIRQQIVNTLTAVVVPTSTRAASAWHNSVGVYGRALPILLSKVQFPKEKNFRRSLPDTWLLVTATVPRPADRWPPNERAFNYPNHRTFLGLFRLDLCILIFLQWFLSENRNLENSRGSWRCQNFIGKILSLSLSSKRKYTEIESSQLPCRARRQRRYLKENLL